MKEYAKMAPKKLEEHMHEEKELLKEKKERKCSSCKKK